MLISHQIKNERIIRVLPPEADRAKQVFSLQALSLSLQRVIVQGITTVERAVINSLGKDATDKERYNLLVEGTDLQAVMATEGVKAVQTTTNHVMETERTLGIEAARGRIIHEINTTMQAHGMSIDVRHRCAARTFVCHMRQRDLTVVSCLRQHASG
jgi:DNA-directed RNA polymerase III subunit RPC1